MSARPEKILALQFKYLGDTVLLTPALRALRGNFPSAEIHLLLPEEVAPLLQHLPWLNRIWAMPRRRGSANVGATWPIIRALRRETFDRSVDFASNDRGAILSRLIGARRRLGWGEPGGFFGRKFCYTERVVPEAKPQHESARLAQLLSAWKIPLPDSLELEIRADPALNAAAAEILPLGAVICHMASSQPNRQWPVEHWAALHRLAAASGLPLAFTTARGAREEALTVELKKVAPDVKVLPLIPELPLFLAMLLRATVFISGDTGPLHFAAGLGVPTISLFGPSSPTRWAPVGNRHHVLVTSSCSCGAGSKICSQANFCLATIAPEQVFERLKICLGGSRRNV